MRKLIESTLVSLDGVIGSPDRWSPFDEESRQLAKEELEKYDALVLGRVTYEFFRANWVPPPATPTSTRSTRYPDTSRPGRSTRRHGTPPSSDPTS
jgi:dihydrofolate reductase